MDHDVVVREKMTEKYLLAELDPALRDQFEEHFFECLDCARDVRAGSDFVAHSKNILAAGSEDAAETARGRANNAPDRHKDPAKDRDRDAGSGSALHWLAWLRPAFAVPALAVLLAVIGYQNFVQLPRIEHSANQPHILPAATVNLLTYGANASPLAVHQGEGFLLNVIVPPGHRYSAYRVDLYGPAGNLEASLPVAGSAADETWPIQFPPASRQSGTYKLSAKGVSAEGQETEVGTSSFEVRIEK
jgi:hypothetical protein